MTINHVYFDIGGVLGTNGWDRRQRTEAEAADCDLAEIFRGAVLRRDGACAGLFDGHSRFAPESRAQNAGKQAGTFEE